MNLLVKIVFTAALALAMTAPSYGQTDKAIGEADKQKAFFENLKKMCGRRFAGETQFPPDPNHPLAGKKLVLSFAS